MTSDQLAQRFHEHYERLAPAFGYETRRSSRKPWGEVPDKNKRLMIAVAEAVASELADEIGRLLGENVQLNCRNDTIQQLGPKLRALVLGQPPPIGPQT